MLLREFTVVDVNDLVNKVRLKMNAIFGGDLAVDRSNTIKGYSGTLPDFLASSQAGSMEEIVAGPVSVDLNYDAKTQLWGEVNKVMRLVQSVMVPFLKLFGVEEGHGLSPFALDMEDPSDLIEKITKFFKPPKRDPRDKVPSRSAAESGQQDYEP